MMRSVFLALVLAFARATTPVPTAAPTLSCGYDHCPSEASIINGTYQYNCTDNPDFKITLVTTNTAIDDGTFNTLAVRGAIAAAKSTGLCVEVDTPLGYGGTQSYFCEMEYATQDSDIVIGVGFLHEGATGRAAGCYPDVSFANIDSDYGLATASNLAGIAYADNEGGYLAGVIAAGIAAAGSGKVGIISGLPVPAVLKFTTAFTNAVVDFCPSCADTEIIVCHTFSNADDCGILAAQSLLAMGVDIIFGAGGLTGSQGIKYAAAPVGTVITSSTGTVFPAKTEDPVYVIGVDSDEYVSTFGSGSVVGSDMIVTSALKQVDVGVKLAIGEFLVGVGGGKTLQMNVANGGMGYAECHEACSAPGYSTTDVEIVYAAMGTPDGYDTRTDAMGECTSGDGIGLSYMCQPEVDDCNWWDSAAGWGVTGDACPGTSGSKKKDDTDVTMYIVIIVVVAVVALIGCAAVAVFYVREKKGSPLFKPMNDAMDYAGDSASPAEVEVTDTKA